MSEDGGFSADWLALRAAADDRARSADLVRAAARNLAVPLRVCDLGAGTGATLHALAPLLPVPQVWTLVDGDAGLLAEARRRAELAALPGVTVEVRQADLLADPAPWPEPPDLVTASALFDLASEEWIGRLAAACAVGKVPMLAMLTYDGRLDVEPAHPLDGAMRDAFNRHQRGMKSFGTALGPDAPQALETTFAAAGYRVEARSTPWELVAGRDDSLMAATLEGWAGAAREILPERSGEVDGWLAARLAGTRQLVVGHRDQLFVPA